MDDGKRSQLRELWAAQLDRSASEVEESANFFELGADSVSVLKLVQQANGRSISLSAQAVYEHPRLGDLLAHLDRSGPADASGSAGASAPARLGSTHLLQHFDVVDAALAQSGLDRSRVADIAPCTPFQAEVMRACHNDGAWMFQTVFELEQGSLEHAKRALGALCEKNDAFRARVVQLDSGLYMLTERARQPDWEEFSGPIHAFKLKDSQRRMTFGQPLSRLAAVHDGSKTYLVWTKSHAIYDRTTKINFMSDLEASLRDVESFTRQTNRPSLNSYLRLVESQDKAKAMAYWKEQLKDVDRLPKLTRRDGPTSNSFLTDAQRSIRRVVEYARPKKTDVGFGAIAEVAWALTLASASKDRNVFFCAMRSGRHAALPGVESILGPTWSMVPFHVDFSRHRTVADVLRAKQENIVKEIAHEAFGVEALQQHFDGNKFLQSVLVPQMPEPETFRGSMRGGDESSGGGAETVLRSAQELWTQVRGHFGLYIMLTPKSDTEVELWGRFDPSFITEEEASSLLKQYEGTITNLIQRSGSWAETPIEKMLPDVQLQDQQSENTVDLSSRPATLKHLFPDPQSSSIAFVLPTEDPLEMSYASLTRHIGQAQETLAELGIKRGDAVSISLPNSYEIVTTFLAVTWQRAIAAPLNPGYKQDEVEFYVGDLESALMVVGRGAFDEDSPAVRAARKFGAAVAEAYLEDDRLVLDVKEKGSKRRAEHGPVLEPSEDDIALVLHTSGTTGRPKAVPLRHKNLVVNIDTIVSTYELKPADRTMLIMPLFHVHGLLASFLSPLRSGGSAVVLASAQPSFWKDFARTKATWYSGTPTMHRLILSFEQPEPLPSIRFIRSCSSQLAPSLFRQLEERFQAPVVESYAMTEASHMMTSNPLPPGARPPGSVGVAHGKVVVEILDEGGAKVPRGQIGEVCVKGENVTHGYLNNDEANRESFTADGFFRTGDQGRLDAESGYLYLTGRLKELINKGGEKISPVELDNVLGQHEDVEEAVCFAVDEETYGQDVGCAVKLKGGRALDEAAVKAYMRERVAAFKVPKKVWVLDKIPKTATGKLQRRLVADKVLADDKPSG